MGYEIRMLVVAKGAPMREYVHDADGSLKKDDKGLHQMTGRTEVYLERRAMVDLCCVGEGETTKLANAAQEAFAPCVEHMVCMYHEGDKRVTEDDYGRPLVPIPISDALKALTSDAYRDTYRRIRWARDLLAAMANDSEPMFVVFYGH